MRARKYEFSAEDDSAIREAYACGRVSLRALAERLGGRFPTYTISVRAGQLGVRRRKEPPWSPEDLALLDELIAEGKTDQAIGKRLGRSAVAVNLKRKRAGIAPRTQQVLSAIEIARRLGIPCAKTVAWWAREGWLKGRRGQRRGNNRQLFVLEDALIAFLENERYWHLWDPERVRDPLLREWALDMRRGVRFLSPSEVAARFCVQHSTVNDWIHRGLLSAVRRGNWLVREDTLRGFTPPSERSKRGLVLHPWSWEDKLRVLDLRQAGTPFEQIAGELGRSVGSVSNVWYRFACDSGYFSLRWEKSS